MQSSHSNQLHSRGSFSGSQSERGVKKKLLGARENASHQVKVGFLFESDWLR